MRGVKGEPLAAGRIFNATAFCLFGPLVWSLHLGAVYAVHHVACRAGAPGEAVIAAFVIGVTVLAAAALGSAALWPAGLAAWLRCPVDDVPMPFFVSVMRWLVLLSAAGIVWAGSGAFFIAGCVP